MSAALNTILVTGATGQQGGATVRELLKQASVSTILALTRDTESKASIALAGMDSRVQPVKGDIATLPQLLAEHRVDGLFLMQHSLDADEVQKGKAVLDSAVQHGLKYVVYSGVDLSGVSDTGLLSYETKRDLWAYSRTLPLKSTYLGPASFLENFLWPNMLEFTQLWPETYVHKLISTSDIGIAAAACFANPDESAGKEINLACEAANPAQIAQTYREVMGKEIGQPTAEIPKFIQVMFKALEQHPFIANPEECHRLFPEFTTLRGWLENVYKPFAESQK